MILSYIQEGDDHVRIESNEAKILSRMGYTGYISEGEWRYGYYRTTGRFLYIPTKKIRNKIERIFIKILKNIDEIKGSVSAELTRAKKLAQAVDIEIDEACDMISHNRSTSGTAWQLLNHMTDHNYTYADIYDMMAVSHHRHISTNYDDIDKSKMTDNQVSELRRSHNN